MAQPRGWRLGHFADFANGPGDGLLSKDKNEIFEYTQALHGLDSLMNLRKTVASAEFRTSRFTLRVFSPLITSLLLPAFWENIILPIITDLGNTIVH